MLLLQLAGIPTSSVESEERAREREREREGGRERERREREKRWGNERINFSTTAALNTNQLQKSVQSF